MLLLLEDPSKRCVILNASSFSFCCYFLLFYIQEKHFRGLVRKGTALGKMVFFRKSLLNYKDLKRTLEWIGFSLKTNFQFSFSHFAN